MVMEVMEEQLRNARFPMLVSPSGREMERMSLLTRDHGCAPDLKSYMSPVPLMVRALVSVS